MQTSPSLPPTNKERNKKRGLEEDELCGGFGLRKMEITKMPLKKKKYRSAMSLGLI